jgi:regulator of sigma E protease
MPGLVMAAQLLMALSILIILHEAGHYFVARFFGIRVEKFYLFFDAWGFKLFHFKKGDTEYGIGWLPLGGYVKIAGMIDESMDKEQMALPPKPDEFRSKPAWQRLLVMLGGVTVNLILGITIFWMLNLFYGQSYIPISRWYKDGIVPGAAFKEIGIKPGDKIIKVGNKIVEKESDLRSMDVLYGNVDLTVVRGAETLIIHVPGDFAKKIGDKNSSDFFFLPRIRPVVDSLLPSGGGFKAGLKKGDQITGVNQNKIEFFDELQETLKNYKNQQINLYFIRNQSPMILPVQLDTAGKMGFLVENHLIKSDTQHFGFFPALTHSLPMAFGAIGDQAKALGKMARGEIKTKQISGPIGIAKIYGANFDWVNFWRITGVLSMILAFMNILPIPALDGGHVLFLLVEMVKGKPLSDKFLENAQMVGFFLLIGLMVFIYGNDILKLFIHQ